MKNEFERILNDLGRCRNLFSQPLWYDAKTTTVSAPNYSNGLNISRGHNISVVKDDNGNIIKHIFKIEYTPFSKENVNVTVSEGNLIVKLAKKEDEKKTNEKNEVIYDGIYSDEWELEFLLPPNVDESKISASCRDGILTIECPVIAPVKEEKKVRNISIK